jgi:hypothetical protein
VSDTAHSNQNRVHVENTIPLLRVESLQASIDYYLKALGFTLDWEVTPMASVSRDGHPIMLCEGAQGNPGTWVWIGVTNAGGLHDEFVSKGAEIRMGPKNFPWAYEMLVEDPDGHVLRFGSGPLEDQPFEEWSEE